MEPSLTTSILDNYVITSPNAGPLSTFPAHHNFSCDDPEPEWTFRPNWALNEFPQLPFVPCSTRWDHPLLQRLRYDYKSLPIERVGICYRLSAAVREKWRDLEYSFLIVAQELLSQAPGGLFPLESRYFPFPHTYGYLRDHTRERAARKCAMRSRDAFIPLMALCSMGISFYTATLVTHGDEPRWVKILVNERKIHPEWVQQLQNSPIADFSERVPRVGVVVDVHECQWLEQMRRLVRVKIPTWFVWSTLDKSLRCSPNPHIKIYFPNRAQVQAAIENHQRQTLAPPLPTEQLFPLPSGPMAGNTSSDQHFPQPNPGSRQRYGETWQDFFARQATRHEKPERKRTPSRTREKRSRCLPLVGCGRLSHPNENQLPRDRRPVGSQTDGPYEVQRL